MHGFLYLLNWGLMIQLLIMVNFQKKKKKMTWFLLFGVKFIISLKEGKY